MGAGLLRKYHRPQDALSRAQRAVDEAASRVAGHASALEVARRDLAAAEAKLAALKPSPEPPPAPVTDDAARKGARRG